MKQILKTIFIILIPVVLGGLVGSLTSFDYNFIKPDFYPPASIFGIVWPILYLLMGISSYIISKELNNEKAMNLYILQLGLNLLWPFVFNINYLVSFILIIILIITVILMIYEFYKLNKTAFYLQIPYLLWLIFASVLNLSIYILN